MTRAGEWYQRGQAETQDELAASTGAALVGVADAGSRFAGTTVEAALQEALVLGDLRVVVATAGAETAGTIEIACSITDAKGTAVTGARLVRIAAMPETDDEGDIAAAGTPVGTLIRAVNPATGENTALMESTAAGLFSFAVDDAVAEDVIVTILADGCLPQLLRLTFAGP